MSVITQSSKTAGQTVKSFSLPAAANTSPPASGPVAAAPPVNGATRLAQLKTDLLALDKAQRETLLQQLFADDLSYIVSEEQKKGFAAGEAAAQQQLQLAQQQLAQARVDDEKEQQQKIDMLTTAVQTFAAQPLNIELKDENILLEIIFTAVLKIVDVQLNDGDYVRDIIRDLAEEFAGQETLQLCLSSRDHHLITELNLQSLLPANMKVSEEDTLLPGSYRIHMDGGAIESKLDDKLRQFKQRLLDTQAANTTVEGY